MGTSESMLFFTASWPSHEAQRPYPSIPRQLCHSSPKPSPAASVQVTGECISIAGKAAFHQGSTAELIFWGRGKHVKMSPQAQFKREQVEVYWMQNGTRTTGLYSCWADGLGASLHGLQFLLLPNEEMGCPVCCRNIPGFCSVDASSTPLIVTSSVFRHCQVSPGT